MNLNLHIDGDIEKFINALVARGFAASKTEAVRLAIVRYYEQSKTFGNWAPEDINKASADNAWDKKKDEEASAFYARKYLHGKKA